MMSLFGAVRSIWFRILYIRPDNGLAKRERVDQTRCPFLYVFMYTIPRTLYLRRLVWALAARIGLCNKNLHIMDWLIYRALLFGSGNVEPIYKHGLSAMCRSVEKTSPVIKQERKCSLIFTWRPI